MVLVMMIFLSKNLVISQPEVAFTTLNDKDEDEDEDDHEQQSGHQLT